MIKKRFLTGAMALAMSMMVITGCASGDNCDHSAGEHNTGK